MFYQAREPRSDVKRLVTELWVTLATYSARSSVYKFRGLNK